MKTDEEWKKSLTPMQYAVLRQSHTERAFTGEHWNRKDDGTYVCAGCGTELFTSADKFDSGCGWPSYTRAILDGRIEEREDTSHGMVRTEVRCSTCGGHLGHVFDDGPGPTGLRYCINSASLDFKKPAARRELGQEQADQIAMQVASSALRGPALRRLAMASIAQLPGYDWAGVYRLEDGALVLDEYVGERTDHTRIEVGQGVCGTAVAENRNVTIADVRTIENYLACSLATRSEIVVLIRKGDTVLGQIDVDGHEIDAFDQRDEALLESIAAILADRWE